NLVSDSGNREAEIDGGLEALGKEARAHVDLGVGDGDEVARDVAGDVPWLCFHDRQKRHGPTPDLGPEPSDPLQEVGMDIEDVPGIGLASRRALQEEGDLTMDPGVL